MKKRRTFLAAAVCCALCPRVALSQAKPGPLSGTLVITGSSTLQPVVDELARAFQARHPAVRFEVKGGGSGRGMSDLREKKSDIGMVSRALKAEENALQSFAIARDGVCFIAHRDNPVKELSRQQLRDIFTGRIANWKALGGRDAAIEVLGRGAERGSTPFVTEYLEIDHAAMRARREVGDNAELIRAVSQAPAAVSFISIGEAERQAKTGVPIRLLGVEGIAATAANVRSGDFPLSRPLMLVTREVPRGLSRAFIEFALSAQARPIIVKHDFVPYAD